ncbi:hypothetical protein [Neorhodopirellula pilleata]|uniref:AhpC/TSA family protein n=1 Tax=Neorhodopirellula pilleata TaxID=2714738 RepID=A0A5C6AYL5_9BACT|nr:hypothetical protein [Neorhodopirellula pilleata]TWU04076.1 hypothetical protein Pla100_10120 [Neorhodopirellula pilleata]
MDRFAVTSIFQRVFFSTWVAGLLLVCASLMVGHWVTLPHPRAGEIVPRTVGWATPSDSEKQVFAFHFLYGDCPCSRRVLKHVLSRQPIPGAIERIVLIGQDQQGQADAIGLGFEVDVVTPAQLKELYGVESAPLLVVSDGSGTIRYSGGYTSRKQGLDIQDQTIIQKTIADQDVEGLPLYGCAVSKSLRAIVDPLNLKEF